MTMMFELTQEQKLFELPGVDLLAPYAQAAQDALDRINEFTTGPAGPAGPTFSTLSAFRAAPITNKKQSLLDPAFPPGDYYFETVDAPYVENLPFTIKADGEALSVGAWRRATAEGITGAARAIYPDMFRLPGDPDDTLSIQRWARARGYKHEGLASRDRTNPYIVTTSDPQGWICELFEGVEYAGNGACIRIAAGTAGYFGIFGSKDPACDLSGLNVHHWDFDHNIQNCPAPAIVDGLLVSPRATVAIKRGSGCWFTDNIIRNFVCTNAVAFNGDGNTSDCHADRNTCLNVGTAPGNEYHDHSTFYVTGDDSSCNLNTGSAAYGAAGAVCFIEMHPGYRYSCIGNTATGFHTGINIAGIYETDSVQGAVTGNTLNCLRRGIALYSGTHAGHTTGFGLDDLLIDGCIIRIRNATPKGFMTGGGPGAFGICAVSGSTLDMRAIRIGSGNSITFDLEAAQADWTSIPVGVGIGQSAGLGESAVFDGFRIDSPTIINCPGIAVVLCIGGGIVKDCSVGDPKIINAGSAGGTSFIADYRAAIWRAPKAYLSSIRIGKPEIVDNLPISRLRFAIVIGSTDDSTTVSDEVGYDLTISGDRVSFVRSIQKSSNTIVTRLNGVQNFPFSAPTGNVLASSQVRDRIANIVYRTLTNSATWSRVVRGSGPPVGSYEDNAEYTDDAAVAGQVLTYISRGGVWKPLTTIGA